MKLPIKNIIIIFVVMLGFVLVFFGLGIFLLGKDFDSLDMCDKEIVKEQIIHNGEYKVIAYIENCGATTGFSPKVAIVEGDDEVHKNNIVFIGDHSLFIDISFDEKENTLHVKHDTDINYIFKNETKYKDLLIKYEYQPTP